MVSRADQLDKLINGWMVNWCPKQMDGQVDIQMDKHVDEWNQRTEINTNTFIYTFDKDRKSCAQNSLYVNIPLSFY